MINFAIALLYWACPVDNVASRSILESSAILPEPLFSRSRRIRRGPISLCSTVSGNVPDVGDRLMEGRPERLPIRRPAMQAQAQPTLYDRLGGIYNIATVVDDFI